MIKDMLLTIQNIASSAMSANEDPEKFMMRPSIKRLYAQLDLLIYNRFGIRVKTISMDDVAYGVITAPPKKDTILSGNIKTIYDRMYKASLKSWTDAEDVVSFQRHYSKIMLDTVKSINTLTAAMDSDNKPVVDLKAKYIHNLGDDYLVYMIHDPLYLSNTISPECWLAVLLHEIGHAFTHISESVKINAVNDTLLQSINNNDSFEKTFKLAYSTGGIKIKKNSSEIETISGLSTIFQTERDNRKSERIADSFAVDLGYGKELVKALETMKSKWSLIDKIYGALEFTKKRTMFELAIIAIGLVGLIKLSAIIIATVIMLGIGSAIQMFLVGIVVGGPDSGFKVYDNQEHRYRRILNRMIMILRSDIDKNLEEKLLADIREVRALIKASPKESVVFDYLPHHFNKSKANKIDRIIEDMINNELHASRRR